MPATPSEKPLVPGEEHHRVESGRDDLSIFVRRLPASCPGGRSPVLYVHGATFPSALSVAHRFDGRSWRDALNEAGHDVWAHDFLGFGASDRYPEMAEPAEAHPPLGRLAEATDQVGRVAEHVRQVTGAGRVSLVAHSWGCATALRLAAERPDLVDRLVLFAPIGLRSGGEPPAGLPAWRDVTLAEQWARFVEDVPAGEPAVLSRRHFDEWGAAYLASDPDRPGAVRVPNGPTHDNRAAAAGELPCDLARIEAPVAIIRGDWDHLSTDADAATLFGALARSHSRRDVKIGRGTHLMHLEAMRLALWRESIAFLDGDDVAPVPA